MLKTQNPARHADRTAFPLGQFGAISRSNPRSHVSANARPNRSRSSAASDQSANQAANSPGQTHDPDRQDASAVRGRRRWILGLALLVVLGAGAVWSQFPFRRRVAAAAVDTPLDERRAFQYLEAICKLGPRPSGSAAMIQQQQMLEQHFRQHGAVVERQSFDIRHPVDGSRVTMTNLIARWFPDRQDRVVLCCHYDTRPFPDQDRRQPRGVFVGANDGASGAALFSELAHHLPNLPTKVGVDLVLFDGEEFIFPRTNEDDYFLGSTHFARDYVGRPPAFRYRSGVLVDMIGDKELQLYYERNSMRLAKPVCQEIWQVARRLKLDDFVARTRHEVRDDHLALNEIAKIPTCDLIDFDYPRPGLTGSYWHTTEDTPDKCSGESICKVGWVLLEFLKQQK
ncbi:MAG: M28 family peptidase [Planctomycetales bacterium]|nr:M28 family peptidase [Planctomycetales bacterium]